MCPVCLGNLTLLAAGASSSGGLTAFALGKFLKKEQTKGKSKMKTAEMKLNPRIVSPEEWEAARQQLLVKEKELTRARDALAAERRRMPWVAVEKDYKFDGPDGKASLLDLFDGRRQ